MMGTGNTAVGQWQSLGSPTSSGPEAMRHALQQVDKPIFVIELEGKPAVASGGRALLGSDERGLCDDGDCPLLAYAPALGPDRLGDDAFKKTYNLRYAYVAGAMANGITSVEMVEGMARAGMMGFFGAAGLDIQAVEHAIDHLKNSLGDLPYGFNLIHSPQDPQLESAIADLYIRKGVRLVSASAYLSMTLPLIRYRLHGIFRDPQGNVVVPNKVVAKVSRVEVARRFLSPPPPDMVKALVECGDITVDQARLAESVPVAEALTAEADSGGHTDNRPAITLLPTMIALRNHMQEKHGYHSRTQVGAAGGIATPASAAAAFAMGAAYILTGTVNQACLEAGTSDVVREMLSKANQADVVMAPAADMFEMGVKVQVLKWGTMFANRASKLYGLYREYSSINEIPEEQRSSIERDLFRGSVDEVWKSTKHFFAQRDPSQVVRGEQDPKHKMALIFRSYLGQASRWANSGDPSRRADYQIWCGPAIGAFNEWTRGSFLESPSRRDVVSVAMNLMVGAAVTTRAHFLRSQGVSLQLGVDAFQPRELEELSALTGS